METESYKPCPFCNTQPKIYSGLSGIGFNYTVAPDDDPAFMLACATESCPIEGMFMGDATWNSCSESTDVMSDSGVKTQPPGKIKEYEEKIKKYFSANQP